MSEETLENISIQFLEEFIFLRKSVKESVTVDNISAFKARRNEFIEFVKLFPCLENQRIETIKEILRERKINDILE